MSLYTRKEFAALCRTTSAIITTNINRGKIILFDKKIDSENRINVAFFDKYNKKAESEIKERNRKKDLTESIDDIYNKVVTKATSKVVGTKKEKAKKKRQDKANKEADLFMDWDIRKKKADTLLQERKAEKEQLQLEKLAGKLLPTDLAFNIIRIHNQSIFATFQNDMENLSSVYCDILAAGDRKLLGELNVKIGELITKSIKAAEDVAIAGIENAVEEYSETRNRGESK